MSFHFTTSHIAFFESDTYKQLSSQIRHESEKYTDTLRLQTMLRKAYPDIEPGLIAATLEQLHVQQLLRRKIPGSDEYIGTVELVQQASSSAAAAIHAGFFSGMGHILECCPGLGADTLSLSAVCSHVTSVESDPVTAAILRFNMHAAGRTNVTIIEGDAAEYLAQHADSFDAVYADPSRRSEGRRTLNPDTYSPPLYSILEHLGNTPAVIKLAPANAPTEGSRVYVGHEGECKELLLLHNIDAPRIQVVEAGSGKWWQPGTAHRPNVDSWKFIVEPHHAIIASDQVENYFNSIGCVAIDDEIAYGVSCELPEASVFHTTFEIVEYFPFSQKRLQRAVEELGFDKRTEIKKRGFPLLPEELQKKIKFPYSGVRGTIIATRMQHRHMVFLCRRRCETR